MQGARVRSESLLAELWIVAQSQIVLCTGSNTQLRLTAIDLLDAQQSAITLHRPGGSLAPRSIDSATRSFPMDCGYASPCEPRNPVPNQSMGNTGFEPVLFLHAYEIMD